MGGTGSTGQTGSTGYTGYTGATGANATTGEHSTCMLHEMCPPTLKGKHMTMQSFEWQRSVHATTLGLLQ